MNRTEQIAALKSYIERDGGCAAIHQANADAGGHYTDDDQQYWIPAVISQRCADAAAYVASVLQRELDALELEDAADCPPAAQLLAAAGHYNDEIPF